MFCVKYMILLQIYNFILMLPKKRDNILSDDVFPILFKDICDRNLTNNYLTSTFWPFLMRMPFCILDVWRPAMS